MTVIPAMTVIQGLWVEGPLSPMEQLSVRSFLAHGYGYDLYAYGEVAGVPAGARVLPAAQVLPADEVFRLRTSTRSVSPFSNVFRYKLLAERGGWWADLDVVCLKPFDFDEEWVLASERDREGGTLATTSLIKAPPGHPLFLQCFEEARRHELREVEWGAIGPAFFDRAVTAHGLGRHLRPPEFFCPVDWWRAEDLRTPAELPESAFSVHLWNERWRVNGWPKEPAPGDPGDPSLYDRLHQRYPPGPVSARS